jgi:hypothetical protein
MTRKFLRIPQRSHVHTGPVSAPPDGEEIGAPLAGEVIILSSISKVRLNSHVRGRSNEIERIKETGIFKTGELNPYGIQVGHQWIKT